MFVRERADAREWLTSLAGMTLFCDCEGITCPAVVLRDAVQRLAATNCCMSSAPDQPGKTAHSFPGAKSSTHDCAEPNSTISAANASADMRSGSGRLDHILHERRFVPSGRRAPQVVAARVAAGSQPSGRALPQLIPDFLSPEEHLQVAMVTQHPLGLSTAAPSWCEAAFTEQDQNCDTVNNRRVDLVDALQALHAVTAQESIRICAAVHPYIRPVVARRSVAFMRELQFVTGAADACFLADFLLGSPMFGWTCHAPAHMQRRTAPDMTIQELLSGALTHNHELLSKVGPSGDAALDEATWAKTQQELDLDMLMGSWYDMKEIPFSEYRLARRFGTWEQHGDADEATARPLDDLKEGEQNDATGMLYVHRPADLDAIGCLTRMANEAFPECALHGFASDFAKAFKQCTNAPEQIAMCILCQWDPHSQRVAFLGARTQLFGGRAAPTNFTRIPAWLCIVACVLAALAMNHCVDDMLCIERGETALSGWFFWRSLAALCGWDIGNDKSPLPSDCFRALGAMVDLRPIPRAPALLSVTDRRRADLLRTLQFILESGRLAPGAAGKLWGRLGFAATQLWGRLGRAQLRAFSRRQHESRSNMNTQLLAAVHWWISQLQSPTSRAIPFRICDMPRVLSYSDGEGDDAGVGVAVWFPDDHTPAAGYCRVPAELRALWSRQRGRGMLYNDIFEIEAVGPLLILDQWGRRMRNCLWLHFIDNEGAQAAPCRGSSSVLSATHGP